MELRDQGCLKCRRSTGGDCGGHGPSVITLGIASTPSPTEVETPPKKAKLADEPAPPLPVAEPAMPVFHFICAMNADHVIYVKIGPGLPPEPTICPWRCGWMRLISERIARGL